MEQHTQQPEAIGQNILRDIVVNLKKSIILVLAIVLLALGVGLVYAKVRKPEYIAEEQVMFSMGDGTYITTEINAMYAYRDTVMDFCDNGVVIDRANFYYDYYKKVSADTDYSLEEFIKEVSFTEAMLKNCVEERAILVEKNALEEAQDTNNQTQGEYWNRQQEIGKLRQKALILEEIRDLLEDINILDEVEDANQIKVKTDKLSEMRGKLIAVNRGESVTINGTTVDVDILDNEIAFYKEQMEYYVAEDYMNSEEEKGENISAGSIGLVEYNTSEDVKAFVFGITYQDNTSQNAIEKVRILVLAYNIESQNFFDNMNASIRDLGTTSCNIDITKTRIVVFSLIIGFVLACAVVYIQRLLDKTVKSKTEAEKLTGVSVISCITRVEE